MTRIKVAIYGDGQLGRMVAAHLSARGAEVLGPASRDAGRGLLNSGAEVVIVATTTRLVEVAADVRAAVEAGSNVIVSAEESAYPWSVDSATAQEIDTLAREHGVSVLGCGVNPGFIFDALVLTLLGPMTAPVSIAVTRTVDIGGFGATVLGRLGVGIEPGDFRAGVGAGAILGHAGFPQSMAVVADALGLVIDRIERKIDPLTTEEAVELPQLRIEAGQTSGVCQTYTAYLDDAPDQPWYVAKFDGRVDLERLRIEPIDEITITGPAGTTTCRLAPGVGAQTGSAAMVANSVERVVAAPPGWRTVAELPPAHPGPGTGRPGRLMGTR